MPTSGAEAGEAPGAAEPLHLVVRRRSPDEVEIVVTGALDVVSVDKLRARLDEVLCEGCRCLIVNLKGVTFADAAALGLLVKTRAVLMRERGVLRLVYRGNPYIERVLRLTGLHRIFG